MIYIDASRYNNTEKRTGVENYSYHLIRKLCELLPGQITLVSPRAIDLKVPQLVIPFPRLWTQLRLSFEVLKNRSLREGTFFIPSHVMPLIAPAKTIITIHDVAWKLFPESYSLASRLYLEWSTKRTVKKAWKILTPSETTKKDLVKLYGADSAKIFVTPLGFEKPATATKPAQTKKYFISIGRIETKKNIDTVIRAFTTFASKNPEINLVLIGKPGVGSREILSLIPPELENRIVRPGYLEDAEKQGYLESALAYIFASRYEGFGLPLLEAMGAGIPVISSDIPASHEVADDAALYFETESASSLSDAMEKIATSESLRQELIQKGTERVKTFSWDKTTTLTLAQF
jgi:glycosyltransferase involved in cell wall biosynthesis